jgi:hypothetical protein
MTGLLAFSSGRGMGFCERERTGALALTAEGGTSPADAHNWQKQCSLGVFFEFVPNTGRNPIGIQCSERKKNPERRRHRAGTQKKLPAEVFFADLQEGGVIPPRFDPYRSFTPPRSVKALVATTPRVIADDVWAKLLRAGLHVTPEDFASWRNPSGRIHTYYPIEMIRAVTVVWLFAGIRGEIRRLRVGCVRWQQDSQSSVCFLDVPVNKTGTAFTKPVEGVVGQTINAWGRVRPAQAELCDQKTGEMVDFLFLHRMRPLGEFFLNHGLIHRLCRKAGVPQNDLRGKITSHRARSTIATQSFNAKEPMSLFELQEWLGPRLPSSTQRYAKITPTKLMKSYSDAGHFSRNLRAIEVLIDQEKVRDGLGAAEAWKFYDLGHGYCTYDFFDQSPAPHGVCEMLFLCAKGFDDGGSS